MGWRAYYKNGKMEMEGDTKTLPDGTIEGVGRPVQAGEDGDLVAIAQEDFGHLVTVDLINGLINIDSKFTFAICEETNIVGELKHIETTFDPWYNCNQTKWIDFPLEDGTTERRQVACEAGSTSPSRCENNHKRKPILHDDGTPVTVRTDILHDLRWRPIWFTRYTNGDPTKVIGAQTTTPVVEGARNVKKLVMLYSNGQIGVD